jgi:CheY-like chemotaxis protein/two-component sensor histidine kinase
MDVGKLRLELEQVDVREVVQGACAALGPSAADKGLDLQVDTGAAPQPALVDPGRLQQVVWNLLTNAVKFTDRGGHIQVLLQSAEDGGLDLAVSDDGQGIKREFLPYLFDRFSQSDSASNRYHGGLGLGLSIVKHLVELHGGHIAVRSDGVGQGTTFRVWLPRRPPAPVQMTASPEAGAAPPPEDLSGMEILVVEDDHEAREMLSMVLRERGATVRLVHDHAEALAALASARPHVLVSDIGLPGKDGYELVRDMRRGEAGGTRLPAIALTAFARAKDREMALDAGFDAHCAKPLQPHELIGTILQVTRAR